VLPPQVWSAPHAASGSQSAHSKTQTITSLSQDEKKAILNLPVIIAGYDQLLRENIQGRDAYFVNFMFNPLPGGINARIEQMRQEVSRVHDILTRHIVRKPKSENWAHLRPIFIGCPDLPVAKNHQTERLKDVKINDGMHYNVDALVPFPCVPNQDPLVKKQSRLRVPLDEHFAQNKHIYARTNCAPFM
jgi:hypothetical protein